MKSEQLAWKIRRHGIEMTHLSGGSHIGAILSVADIMAVLYTNILKFDSKNPDWEKRDKVILSKGHAGASLYAALAENGFFPVKELKTHYANGSRLSGHVSHYLPGIELSTGALGHGLSVGTGMAYASKKDNKKNKTYVILGDGECNEGSVWEAALFANHFRLNNLTAVIDYNHMQSLDYCDNTLEITPFAEKWRAFGWNVIEIDGHSHEQLREGFRCAENSGQKPTVIIASTVKGNGISFMENDILWHYRFPHEGWEYECAVNELHKQKPEGVEDIYTPEGFPNTTYTPEPEKSNHVFSNTWESTLERGKMDWTGSRENERYFCKNLN